MPEPANSMGNTAWVSVYFPAAGAHGQGHSGG